MNSKWQNRRGHTLMELIVAVIIISAVASLAAGRYTDYLKRMGSQEAVQVLIAVWGAQKEFWNDSGRTHYFEGDQDEINDTLGVSISNFRADTFKELEAFDNNVAVCAQNVVASVIRDDDTYKLGITAAGQIACGDGAGACGNPLCDRMGF